MSWDRIEGQWKQRRGKAMNHWGKVMNDELAAIAGKYEEYVGRLQEKYGIAKEKAADQIDEFKRTVEQLKNSNGKLIQLQKSLHDKERRKRNGVRTSGGVSKNGKRKPLKKTARSRAR